MQVLCRPRLPIGSQLASRYCTVSDRPDIHDAWKASALQHLRIPDWLDLRPGATPRPIDRRIRIARHLAADDLPEFAPKWADQISRRAADVLRGAQPADEVIKAALDLRTAPPLVRGEVEARLLAEQEPGDVAAAMGLSAGVVDTYAKLFFDLTDSWNARSWMLHEGIGRKAYCGLTPDDVDVILKLIGFIFGLGVLEPVVRYYRRGLHRVADLDDVPDLDAEERAWARSIRLWVAVRTLNDPVALLRLRAAFPETQPQSSASPALHYRLTLERAAEAFVRASGAVTAAQEQEQPASTASVGPARKPAGRSARTAATRRTRTHIRPLAPGALVPAGA